MLFLTQRLICRMFTTFKPHNKQISFLGFKGGDPVKVFSLVRSNIMVRHYITKFFLSLDDDRLH